MPSRSQPHRSRYTATANAATTGAEQAHHTARRKGPGFARRAQNTHWHLPRPCETASPLLCRPGPCFGCWDFVVCWRSFYGPGKPQRATDRHAPFLRQVTILSGTEFGFTLGTPIALHVPNQNVRKRDYSEMLVIPRPGHADYTYQVSLVVRPPSPPCAHAHPCAHNSKCVPGGTMAFFCYCCAAQVRTPG